MESKPKFIEGFVQGNGIKLHYLDWGGPGQPLVLIHGLGDSPYIFEELSSSLKSNFRIIAYSRRGHCKSESVDSSFDNTTLVSDLKLLLDSLKISKASLLGWSMGGNEITEFAIRYPERTHKLIYFESGYDLSNGEFKKIVEALPQSPFPNNQDLKSIDTYRRWYHKFWFVDVEWNPTLEANLKASTQINSDNTVSIIPNDRISKLILQSIMDYHRDYKMIQAPALVLYTKQFFVPSENDMGIISTYEKIEKELVDPWRLKNMNQIKTELKNATIKVLPKGSHASFIFLSKDSLIESINSFLLD